MMQHYTLERTSLNSFNDGFPKEKASSMFKRYNLQARAFVRRKQQVFV